MRLKLKTAAPIAVLALTVGGCTASEPAADTGGPADATNTSPQRPATDARVARAYVGVPDDPSTWRLPIEAYMPSHTQTRLVTGARDGLIDRCMSEAGYPAWKPAPDLPEVGGKSLTDWRYGIHDSELAAKRGYHPDAEEQRAYDDAMQEGAVDESGAPPDVLRGCATQADGDVPAAQPAAIVQQVGGEAFSEAQRDRKVVAAFAQWSACMKGKGFTYAAPMDANDDPRFADPHVVTRLEIDTAKADTACRERHHVNRTWFDAESTIQRAKIAGHLKEFDDAAEAVGLAVAKAAAV